MSGRWTDWGCRKLAWIAVLASAAIASGCCSFWCTGWCEKKCEPDLKADYWIVVHNRGQASGQPWKQCEYDSPNDRVGFLPTCITVHNNETVGFKNYSDYKIEIYHYNTLLNAPNPIEMAPKTSKAFKVSPSAQSMLLDIKSIVPNASGDHGGPEMIVQP